MKFILIIMVLLVSSGAFSQSKKKQIEMLQHQVDSMQSQQVEIQQNSAQLKKENEVLRKIMKGYVYQIDSLMRYNIWLENELEEMHLENSRLEEKKEEKTTTSSKGGIRTNSNNTSNTTSGNNSTNPFGTGETITGFGSDDGTINGDGPGNGIGYNKQRSRLTNVDVSEIKIDLDASIGYKLTVDADGNVVAFTNVRSNTTTTDLTLINKIGAAIKEQVKYNKVEGAPLTYQFYTIKVKAN